MILINLLPHREAARKRQKEQFYTQLGLSALLGGVICGGVFVWYQGQISTQQERNSFLQSEIARLDNEIKDIATLQAQIASLRARQTAVEDLQANRNLPVHLLDELVTQLPDGVFSDQRETGKPECADDRGGPVAGTGVRTAAQPVQPECLAEQAAAG